MKIACLPIAGPENPYQQLMMAGLCQAGHSVSHGKTGRWFALSRTALAGAEALHLDWPGSYYLRRNTVLAMVQTLAFAADLLFLRLLRKPLIWTVHNLHEHEGLHPKLEAWAKRRLANEARRVRVFAPRQVAKAEARLGIQASKILVVAEGGYQEHYPPALAQSDARQRLELSLVGRVVVHIGNLRPYKGTDALVAAFKAVAGPDDRLLIAGPARRTAFVDSLRLAIGDDKRILLKPGLVADADLPAYLCAADVAAFPFRRIDNSGSVILAMGYGLPVVAPATGALTFRLAAQPGLLFGDGKSLEQVLAEALAIEKTTLQGLGRANLAQVERHRWEDFAAAFIW